MTDIIEHTLKNRYYQPNESSWDDIAKRVSNCIGRNDEEKNKFYKVIHNKVFIPNSPTLMNAGTKLNQFSACFVIPVPDDMKGIGDAVTNSMLISKSGGGVGYSFEEIRPKNSTVASTNGVASGVVSFIGLFDEATNVVKQAGRRRGANMGVLPIWHPDIEDFIDAKLEDGVLSNFNLSVAITDDFMNAVENDLDFELKFDYNDKSITKTVNSKYIFNKIVDNMWNNGEPGIIFIDTINKNNKYDIPIKATNPCGEQPLISNSACNLGSIDVSKFYVNGEFDWVGFKETINTAVCFLNNTIDINNFPLKEIEKTVKKYRPIGLGLMGVADLFIKMKMKYGNEESLWFAEEIAKTLYETAEKCSEKYAIENRTVKNVTLISYAPTGTISMFAGCSSGIEPNFAFKYNRRTWVNGEENKFVQYHPLYEKYKNSDSLPDYIVTTMQIKPEDHIKMQSVFQKYCDSGISKTINIPNNATKYNIYNLIFMAWKLGCKGFTMYRDGSRTSQVLSCDEKVVKNKQEEVKEISTKRPSVLSGTTYKKYSGCGKLYVTVNEKDGKPYEVIVQTSGIGGCPANTEAIGRAISAGLRNGVSATEYIRQLNRVICPKCKNGKKVDGKSCADIIGKCLSLGLDFENDKTELKNEEIKNNKNNVSKCPECGEEIFMMEGCITCPSCGYSKCS
jgi:ribonucleoside-diphosphate reductase alpha chain